MSQVTVEPVNSKTNNGPTFPDISCPPKERIPYFCYFTYLYFFSPTCAMTLQCDSLSKYPQNILDPADVLQSIFPRLIGRCGSAPETTLQKIFIKPDTKLKPDTTQLQYKLHTSALLAWCCVRFYMILLIKYLPAPQLTA